MADATSTRARTYLARLGLEPGAGMDEVRSAYRRLASRWHPDRFTPGTDNYVRAEERIKQINEAYTWLRSNEDTWPQSFVPPPRNERPSDAFEPDSARGQSKERAHKPPESNQKNSPREPTDSTGQASHQWIGWLVGAGIGLVIVLGLVKDYADSRATTHRPQVAAPIQRPNAPQSSNAPRASPIQTPKPTPVVAQQPKPTEMVRESPVDDLAAAVREFEDADFELNRVYQELREKAANELFVELRDTQRLWLKGRDVLAEDHAHFMRGRRNEAEPPEEWPEYWQARAATTRNRTMYLQAWFDSMSGKFEYLGPWAGFWVDGYGGWLYIQQVDVGRIEFAIDVVRGSTVHLGEIAGRAEVVGDTATFETYIEGVSEAAGLEFVRRGPIIEVNGSGSIGQFGGARAFFTGDYARQKPLDSGLAATLERALHDPDFSFHRSTY